MKTSVTSHCVIIYSFLDFFFGFFFLMLCDLILLGLQMTSELRTTPTNDKWCIFVVFGGVSEFQFWHCAGAKSDNVLELHGIRMVRSDRGVAGSTAVRLSAGMLGYFRK